MIRRIQHDALNLENCFDGDDDRWVLVSWDQDPNMADAGLSDEIVEFHRVLGIDQGAASDQTDRTGQELGSGLQNGLQV